MKMIHNYSILTMKCNLFFKYISNNKGIIEQSTRNKSNVTLRRRINAGKIKIKDIIWEKKAYLTCISSKTWSKWKQTKVIIWEKAASIQKIERTIDICIKESDK